MVRIPTFDDNSQLDTGSNFFRPTRNDGGQAIGHALQGVGENLDSVAAAIKAKEDRTAKIDAEKKILDWSDRTNRYVEEQQKNIPENGRGFYQATMASVQKDAQSVIDSLPDSIRGEYEVKMRAHLNQTSNQVAGIENAQDRNYLKTVTERKFNQLADGVKSGFVTKDAGVAEAENFLKGMGLQPNHYEVLRREMVRGVEAAALENLRTTNPTEFYRATQKYLPNGPSAEAGTTQRLVIERANAYGIDPSIPLMIGTIESGWDKNATASKTIAGLFQLSKEERVRLGIPESMKFDPALQTEAIMRLIKENQNRLVANGIEVTPATTWAAHFLGKGGVVAMYWADKNADAYDVYRSAAGQSTADQSFAQNGKLLQRGMTVGQVQQAIENKVARGMIDAAKFLETKTPTTTGPLEVMGQKFEVLQPADLAGNAAAAVKSIQDDNTKRLQLEAKQKYIDDGQFNRHDPADRKYVDEAAKADGAQARIVGGDGPTIAKYAALGMKGYLPKDAAQGALALMDSKNRTQQITGYELAATAFKGGREPGLQYSGITGDTAKRVRDYVNLTIDGNIPPDEAIRRIEQMHDPAFKLKETDLRSKLEKSVTARTYTEAARSMGIRSGWWGLTSTAEPPIADMKTRIEERYQQYFRFHMLDSNGDIEVSKANAINDLKRTYGQTKLFGKAQYAMLYPPERTYLPNGSFKESELGGDLSPQRAKELYGYITDQAVDRAKVLAARSGWVKEAPTLDRTTVALVPNVNTKIDVESGSSTPRYTLAFKIRGYWQFGTHEFTANPQFAAANTIPDATPEAVRAVAPRASPNAADLFRAKREGK